MRYSSLKSTHLRGKYAGKVDTSDIIVTRKFPMINVICDAASWVDLLGSIREQQRFSSPADYDQNLLDTHGRPLLVEIDTLRIHIYPPARI